MRFYDVGLAQFEMGEIRRRKNQIQIIPQKNQKSRKSRSKSLSFELSCFEQRKFIEQQQIECFLQRIHEY